MGRGRARTGRTDAAPMMELPDVHAFACFARQQRTLRAFVRVLLRFADAPDCVQNGIQRVGIAVGAPDPQDPKRWPPIADPRTAAGPRRLRCFGHETSQRGRLFEAAEHGRDLVHAFHQANVAEPDLRRILQYEAIRGGDRLEYVFQHYLAPVRDAVAPLVQSLVEQGCVRPIPIDVMVYAVVAINSVSAEVPLASLLGDTFAADPSGYAGLLSDILLDGLVVPQPRK